MNYNVNWLCVILHVVEYRVNFIPFGLLNFSSANRGTLYLEFYTFILYIVNVKSSDIIACVFVGKEFKIVQMMDNAPAHVEIIAKQ
jgi:hypothetical protein